MDQRGRRWFGAMALLVLPLHGAAAAAQAPHLERVVAVEAGAVASDELIVRAAQVAWGLQRFADVELALPPVEILIGGQDDCDGKGGVYGWDGTTGRIGWCDPRLFVLLHELAHAWQSLNMDEADRALFVAWHDAAVDWNDADAWLERGVEVSANLIAHGLLPDPLEQGSIGSGRREALDGFRRLTGQVSPRIVVE